MASEPRYAFFETDARLELNIFLKGLDSGSVAVQFEPRKFSFDSGDYSLILEPLRGEVDPDKCAYRIGAVKIEVNLTKRFPGIWGAIVGDAAQVSQTNPSSNLTSGDEDRASRPFSKKNWDSVASEALEKEGKDKTLAEDANAGGDAAVNSFFQQIYRDADEDTKRAMLKSFTESGGTSLSTDWKDVSKKKVEVVPPSGSEYKKWS